MVFSGAVDITGIAIVQAPNSVRVLSEPYSAERLSGSRPQAIYPHELMKPLVDSFKRLEPSVSSHYDVVGIVCPDQGLGVGGVVVADEAIDGRLEIYDRMEHAVLKPALGNLAKKPSSA